MSLIARLVVLCLVLTACGGNKQNRMPSMFIDPDNPPVSEVRIPVRLSLSELQRNLNEQMGEVIFEDDNADGEGLVLRASRRAPITLSINGDAIEYEVPLEIYLKKPYRLANVEGMGKLDIRFRTYYDIRTDWSFATNTEIMEYNWLEKPKVQVGIIRLPIEFIANKALERSRDMISTAIDDQLSQLLDLRASLDAAWVDMHSPTSLSDEYRTWMVLNPKSIGMSPLQSDGSVWSSTITASARPEVYLGREPDHALPPPLPLFNWQEPEDQGFSIFIRTEIPYDQAETMARENLVGETFTQGSRAVTVTGIDIYGKGNKMAVATFLEGAFTGSIEVLMQPSYNEDTETFDITVENMSVRTGNFLHKSAAWLLKGKLRKELEAQIRYYLNENMRILHETVEGQLKASDLGGGLQLNGVLTALELRSVLLKTDYLELWIEMNGAIGVSW